MSIRLIHGDCREVLATLPVESVHCCVTSPPYFGLRDYGTAQWDGGDLACEHVGNRSVGASTLKNDGRLNIGYQPGNKIPGVPYRNICLDCGAIRVDRQIGLEPTPDAYVATLVEVFRQVRRVLRADGTLWLNLGDSFAAKQLIGIPWRVAFALQADGWYLRSDIIWAKPNPMPESVTDRPTKAHEYLFLLAKSERYYYDAEAIEEPVTGNAHARGSGINPKAVQPGLGIKQNTSFSAAICNLVDSRNRRSVWTVATQAFSEAHFATFPPALIEPCILAGCPEKVCARCSAPWMRQIERIDTGRTQKMADGWDTGSGAHGTIHRTGREHGENGKPVMTTVTTGFAPSCTCDASVLSGTVLDPFGGAGTTGLVADRLQRNAVLIELNPKYSDMAERRIVDDGPLFADVVAIAKTLGGA